MRNTLQLRIKLNVEWPKVNDPIQFQLVLKRMTLSRSNLPVLASFHSFLLVSPIGSKLIVCTHLVWKQCTFNRNISHFQYFKLSFRIFCLFVALILTRIFHQCSSIFFFINCKNKSKQQQQNTKSKCELNWIEFKWPFYFLFWMCVCVYCILWKSYFAVSVA